MTRNKVLKFRKITVTVLEYLMENLVFSFHFFDPSWNSPPPEKLQPVREKLITNSFGTFNVKQYGPTPGGR